MDIIKEMVGKTLTEIKNNGDSLTFICNDNTSYKMYHAQDCCESVTIDDINGDFDDLIGNPLIVAEETSNKEFEDNWYANLPENEKRYMDSYTWTFYRFATIKGWVNIRWFGESNGYYSESVDVILLGTDREW